MGLAGRWEPMSSERMRKIFSMVAPGTPLREGLDNILRARTGGLVVVGDVPEVLAIASGGFKLNADFSPAALYELAKMDGAIILSSTADRIVWANATLSPDPDIPSRETGLRHSTAERVAKMTGQLVIAISQRRSVITVYMGHTRYVLRDIGVVLAKANQALQTMANYKEVFSRALTNLSALEFIEEVTVADVVRVIQRYELMRRAWEEVTDYIAELGSEGRLIKVQSDEIIGGTWEDALFVMMDYLPSGGQEEAEAAAVHRGVAGGRGAGRVDSWARRHTERHREPGVLDDAKGLQGAVEDFEAAAVGDTQRGERVRVAESDKGSHNRGT